MKRIQRLFLVASLVAAAIGLLACNAAPTTTTAPESIPVNNAPANTKVPQSAPGNAAPAETTEPQSVPFNSDGVITPGEYAYNETYDDFQVNWKNDDKDIYVAVKAKTTGFVAVGIQPGVTMLNADIILGFVKDGKAQVFDLYSTGTFGPHPQDTELGGTNDILQAGGSEDGQYTVIEFKRALNTGDKYDRELVNGINKIIWAYGPNKDMNLKHTSRGYGEIEIK